MAWKDLHHDILEEFAGHVSHEEEWEHAAATDARSLQAERRKLHRSLGLCVHCNRGAHKAKLCRKHYAEHVEFKQAWYRTEKGKAFRASRQSYVNEWRDRWRARRREAGLPVT